MTSGSVQNESSFAETARQWAHHSDLVMYARRVLGDRSDAAEDIVQEAYLRLLRLAASDEAPTGARPWLFRVVRNLAIDERRSAARRAAPVAEPEVLGTAARDDTEFLVEHRAELAGALREIAALPARERRAIEMDQAGIGAQAIATELGTTPNAVHQALFRARKRLRQYRAVAWGLIPVALAPFALRLSNPALAATIANLPPGVPVGRALPVAGIVAAAMVGGSIVVPAVDHTPANVKTAQFLEQRAAANAAASSRASNAHDDPSDRGAQASSRGASSSSSGGDASRSNDRSDDGTGRGNHPGTSGDDGNARSGRGVDAGETRAGSPGRTGDGGSERISRPAADEPAKADSGDGGDHQGGKSSEERPESRSGDTPPGGDGS